MHVHLTVLICIIFIREVKDRDEINEFLRNEIRLADMKAKVRCVAIYTYLPNNCTCFVYRLYVV